MCQFLLYKPNVGFVTMKPSHKGYNLGWFKLSFVSYFFIFFVHEHPSYFRKDFEMLLAAKEGEI